jgi:hypothetical protein
MLSPQALIRGLVSRGRPSFNPDSLNNDVALRQWSYGESAVMSVVRKAHLLADEGSYFTIHNNQTGVTTNNGTSFSATAPFLIVQNGNSVASGLRVYLDYLALVTTTAGSAASGASSINAAVAIDSALRFSSGGTTLGAPQGVNMDQSLVSNVTCYVGAVTASAASGAARTLCGFRILRPTVSATVLDVLGEQKYCNFGNVEGGQGSFTLANANLITNTFPAVVIGPQSSALFYIWTTSTTPVTPQYAPEIGLWVR